jgi:hypothetical protein
VSETRGTQHIPGPWRYCPEGDGRSRGYIRQMSPHYTGLGVALARVVGFSESGPSACDANGRLMAAAPDGHALLEEVAEVLRRGGDFQLGHKGKHRDLLERLDAYFARARGEQR